MALRDDYLIKDELQIMFYKSDHNSTPITTLRDPHREFGGLSRAGRSSLDAV